MLSKPCAFSCGRSLTLRWWCALRLLLLLLLALLLRQRLHDLVERDGRLEASSNQGPLPCEASLFLDPMHQPRVSHR